jgi:hypothetical protein
MSGTALGRRVTRPRLWVCVVTLTVDRLIEEFVVHICHGMQGMSRTMVRSAANHATQAFYIQLKVQFLCHAPPLVKSSNPDSFNTLEVWL